MNRNERRIVGFLRQLFRRCEDRLFASDDAWARHRGLQISRRPNGHGRRYRDPRWDLVTACPECTDIGASGIGRCGECGDRGTVRLDQAPTVTRNPP